MSVLAKNQSESFVKTFFRALCVSIKTWLLFAARNPSDAGKQLLDFGVFVVALTFMLNVVLIMLAIPVIEIAVVVLIILSVMA